MMADSILHPCSFLGESLTYNVWDVYNVNICDHSQSF